MTDDLDEFSTPIGTGMTRCPTVPLRDEDALRARLDAFDAMRCRGAAEAALTPLIPRRSTCDR